MEKKNKPTKQLVAQIIRSFFMDGSQTFYVKLTKDLKRGKVIKFDTSSFEGIYGTGFLDEVTESNLRNYGEEK